MMDETILTNKLEQGLHKLGLNLSAAPFLNYLLLLKKWNQAYNLTAIRQLDDMVTRHVFDSLAILPWIKGTRIIDVGTGAGLPGIVLALARPEFEMVLLDSNGKKTRFLNEAIRILGLNQVSVVQKRVEDYHPEHHFDTVTSRAFSELALLTKWTHHLLARDGVWLAMKGRTPDVELANLTYPYRVEPYFVPGLTEQRCCIIMNKE